MSPLRARQATLLLMNRLTAWDRQSWSARLRRRLRIRLRNHGEIVRAHANRESPKSAALPFPQCSNWFGRRDTAGKRFARPLALSEAVPVIGTVVPGSTLNLAISALATTAGIMPWALLVAAVLGAIAGDGFSFWLGHRYQRQMLSGWPLNRFPWLIERSAQFIRKYGITSVFLARFTAVVRAFVLLLAGILRMSSRQFYVANIPSALVWAPMHVFPGVLLGLAVAFGGTHAPQLSLAAVGVLILVWIAWSMIRYKTAAVLECAASHQAPGSDARKSSPWPTFRADRTGQPDR